MEKNYDAAVIEAKWYRYWLEHKTFHKDADAAGEPYCIMIPPPNVTGILHMGHALNNTIQDILIRWRRMQGRNAVWVPGTDHAGIATQNVVERALRKEGRSREDLGREAFVERVWEWREEYGGTIINQLKRLGSACDWDRERFTMDEGLSRAVTEVFVRLYEKGLIYRANYIINWCPRCHTALSDEESEHAETQGKLYYIRYPVKQKDGQERFLTVATTRPETLLGDTAVAVNPEDSRYTDLEDESVELPILGRRLRVIRDAYVDREFGTGVVKVTPAHDPNDFEMGQRHGLEQINVMNGDGTMNDAAGPYAGMDRFACRKKLLQDLESLNLLEKTEAHAHAVGHCYRCDTVVEPRLSPQWFVKMKPLAEPAIQAVKEGRLEFVPGRWTKVYLEWMENIRDWCISRQIWWGHRIPVYTCQDCAHEWAARTTPGRCPVCASTAIRQDEDVLDTWFSSWLWPFSTLGWPDESRDLACYYPTHDLVTASEIIFFWVARMVMAGFEFMGDVPFRKVYIHGTVRDDHGRKMSKSLGNSIDPLTMINEYSADALRFSLMMITATGQDVYVSNEKFEIGRNFGTKLWNAARFMQMHADGVDLDPASLVHTPPDFSAMDLTPDDCYLLHKLESASQACSDNLEKFRFNDAALALYDFFWHQFCDWYVEYSKASLNGTDAAAKRQTLTVMYVSLGTALRLLHPFMPFLTEELWHVMGFGTETEALLDAAWPQPDPDVARRPVGDRSVIDYVEQKHDLIRAARTLRADYSVAPSQEVEFIVRPAETKSAELLQHDVRSVAALLRPATLRVEPGYQAARAVPGAVTPLGTLYMPLSGVIDVAAEIARQQTQLEKLKTDCKRIATKLENQNFVTRAPADVVQRERDRREELLQKCTKLETLIATLAELAKA